MDVIHKQNPLLSPVNLQRELGYKYGFKTINCQLINNDRNTVYTVNDGIVKYIFKFYEIHTKNLDEIEAEIEILNLLRIRGAKVSYPISDQYGNYIQHIEIEEGVLYGVLYSFAEGNVSYRLNDQQLVNTARELATIHSITSGLRLNHHVKEHNLINITNESLENIKPAFLKPGKDYDELYKVSIEVLKKLESIDLTQLSTGYCHHDFFQGNFHFKEDNSITIFDFEDMRRGCLIIDVASIYSFYLLLFCVGEITSGQLNKTFNFFIENYRSIRYISDLEIQLIPHFCFGMLINSIAFAVEYKIDFVTNGYLKNVMMAIKQLNSWTH